MLTRRLALKREALTPLTDEDLTVFGGAANTRPCPTPPYYLPTAPVTQCRLSVDVCLSGDVCAVRG